MTRVRPPLLTAAAVVAALVLGSACAREIVGEPPPLDQPHFPRGLALHPERPLLAVVSSNFDLEFNRGALLLADLDQVDAAIDAADGAFVRLQGDTLPYTDVALIPSFGNEPVFVLGGERLLLPTQEQNRLSEIPLTFDDDDDGVAFDCAVTEEAERPVPLCGEPEQSLQLPGNDPSDIAVLEETDTSVQAIVTLLNSPEVFYVTLDLEEEPSRRMVVDGGPSFSLEGYAGDLGEALGVRSVALRPAAGGVPTTAFLTVSRTSFGLTNQAVDLVSFDASQGRGRDLEVLQLTTETGSIDARDIAVSPDGDALFVILRDPDALARVELRSSGGRLEARVGGVVSTCYDPIEVEAFTLPTASGDVTRVLVTCFDNDTVVAYHPLALVETEVLRGLGDGPYGLAVDLEHDPPRAYVGFFNDDRVGVIDLLDDEGEARLVPRAVIGTPREDAEAAQ